MSSIIAFSDEFTAELNDDGFVDIVDGENVIRVTMPLEILKDLCKQVCQIPD